MDRTVSERNKQYEEEFMKLKEATSDNVISVRNPNVMQRPAIGQFD